MIPSGLLKDTFTLKQLVSAHSTGRMTQTVSVVSTGLKGYFQPRSGTLVQGLLGKAKQYSMKLFTKVNTDIIPNRIIVYGDFEYVVLSVDTFNTPGLGHHMEIYLEEKRTSLG